ncbi:MAG: histone RNA hairpin-binding protein RNA-binding domain-containing protein [Monoraphidium minutum]|nr:MAG: histone RNA hairpin-binding protein RNA-binding domain-containing protein [Monoraphidium minutum]
MDHTDQFMLDDEEEAECFQLNSGGPGQEGGGGGGDPELETDAARLAQRQKQIDLGKNTQAYRNYIKAVPRHKRKLKGKDMHPSTPDISLKASKRCWQGMVRVWKKKLHFYDDQAAAEGEGGQPHQPAQARREEGHAADYGRRGDMGAWRGGRTVGEQQHGGQDGRSQPDNHTIAGRVTPSKRQHNGGSTEDGSPSDHSGAGQRDAGAKRSRPSGSGGGVACTAAAPLAVAKGPQPLKNWADQVDDAFGEWVE